MTPFKFTAMQQQKAKGSYLNAKKFYLLPFYFLLLGGLFSCKNLAESGFSVPPTGNVAVTKVGELKDKRKANSTIYLKGKVGNQAPFLDSAAYELQDTSGSIWVVTKKAIPAKGDQVLIKGKVQYQNLPLIFAAGGKEIGEVYVQEQEQLERKSAEKSWELLPKGKE